jgi:histidinol-phosphate aminotransferase
VALSVSWPTVHLVTVRDDLKGLQGYHSPQVEVRVRLNTNEAPTAPPAAWRDAFAAELSRVEWNRYPDRSASALRSAIADSHHVRADQVFAANGSNEVLQTLLLAYAGPGRRVATFEPTYQLHAHIARLTGATAIEAERDADFRLDLDTALDLIAESHPDVTFLCSPNNPTGLVEPVDNVRALLDAEPGLLVVDEAYAQFAGWSALTMVDESTPLVVTRTFSKTWSMAATRLGYLVGPSWLVSELDKVTLPYHLDAAKQIAGRLALQFTDEMDARVEEIISERDRISQTLAQLALDVFPSGANFILFRPRHKPGRQVWDELLERSILIRDCSGWPRLTDCLRVTIGTSDENDEFLAAMKEIVQ